jgi:hypothetical protein
MTPGQLVPVMSSGVETSLIILTILTRAIKVSSERFLDSAPLRPE